MRIFLGRSDYLKNLESLWSEQGARAIAIYGRRRVGKSALIRQFCRNKAAWLFEAVEGGDTSFQIRHFLNQLSIICQEPHLADLVYDDWPPVFELLSQKIMQQKHLVLAFDEVSWMAAGQTRLVAYLKYFWDQKWKYHPRLVFILCGSVASWMIKNIVRSRALYGRLSQHILLHPLMPDEVANYIGKRRGRRETLEYLLCFGGIPRYLEEFDFNQSLELNIEKTCLSKSGFFVEEAEKIFYNQFRETKNYKKIVRALMGQPLALKEVADILGMASGGGIKAYLDNLIATDIVSEIHEVREDLNVSKTSRYYVSDPFLRFHHQFIEPHRSDFTELGRRGDFAKWTKNQWYPFLGNAFERFCLKHRDLIAGILGIESKVIAASGLARKKRSGYQFDLVFLRSDHVLSVCEIKFVDSPPGTTLIAEMEKKLSHFKAPSDYTIEKILISNQSPTKSLRESGYFHRHVQAGELWEKK